MNAIYYTSEKARVQIGKHRAKRKRSQRKRIAVYSAQRCCAPFGNFAMKGSALKTVSRICLIFLFCPKVFELLKLFTKKVLSHRRHVPSLLPCPTFEHLDERVYLPEFFHIDAVHGKPALAFGAHETAAGEDFHVVGKGGLCHIEAMEEVVRAKALASEHLHDFQARLVGERLEQGNILRKVCCHSSYPASVFTGRVGRLSSAGDGGYGVNNASFTFFKQVSMLSTPSV